MDEEKEYEPKLSTVEIFIVTFFLGLIDLGGMFLAFFLLDDFWIADLLATTVTIYLFFRGVSALRYVAMWILELFPFVGSLPLLTVGFLLTVWLDRHPKIAHTVEAVAVVKGKMSAARGAVAEVRTGRDFVHAVSETLQSDEFSSPEDTEGSAPRDSGSPQYGGMAAEKSEGEQEMEQETEAEDYGMPREYLSPSETTAILSGENGTINQTEDNVVSINKNSINLKNLKKAA